MTDTPLYEKTVHSTKVLPDPDSIPADELEEVRLIGRSLFTVAFLRAFGRPVLKVLGLSPTGRAIVNMPAIQSTVDGRGREHDPSNGRFIPSRRLDKDN